MFAALISAAVLFLLAAGVLAFRAWSTRKLTAAPPAQPESVAVPDNVISLEDWRAAREAVPARAEEPVHS